MTSSKPIFVKIDKHKELIEIMEVIDKKVDSAKKMLAELEELKRREDEEIGKWNTSLEEIEHKIGNMKEELHN
jgi:hypothetical protein